MDAICVMLYSRPNVSSITLFVLSTQFKATFLKVLLVFTIAPRSSSCCNAVVLVNIKVGQKARGRGIVVVDKMNQVHICI